MSKHTRVYLTESRFSRRYHTDDDCAYLPSDSAQIVEKPLSALGGHYDECCYCANERPDYGGGSRKINDALRRADANDVPPDSADG